MYCALAGLVDRLYLHCFKKINVVFFTDFFMNLELNPVFSHSFWVFALHDCSAWQLVTCKSFRVQCYHDDSAVTDELVEKILLPGLQPGAVDVFLDFICYSGGPLPEEMLPNIQAWQLNSSYAFLSPCFEKCFSDSI